MLSQCGCLASFQGSSGSVLHILQAAMLAVMSQCGCTGSFQGTALAAGQCWQCCPSVGTQDPSRALHWLLRSAGNAVPLWVHRIFVGLLWFCAAYPAGYSHISFFLSPWLSISLLPAALPSLPRVTHTLSSPWFNQDSSAKWPLCEDSHGMGGGKRQGRLTEQWDRDGLLGTSDVMNACSACYKSNAFL